MQLQGLKRKIVQAISYEVLAIIMVSPFVATLFGKSLSNAASLSVILSMLALFWNMAFNYLFEMWEARQADTTRTLKRRIIHALGFEAGFGLLVVPITAFWLAISWQAALATNIGLMLFFMVYQFGFQWLFDKTFGLPNSALVNAK
ncbi:MULTISPECIES: PACE efflux transporter [Vitreoscilla]|uniref:PACE efflux transporter n=1 Tax=Vitreoscilla stercoraria TaxID=61 RepID=A0ABY4EIR6_VITST|nr:MULTISPECIES: PACE efflux transporter [Vitreoscilla]AUZ05432.1 bacterial transmembrane pair family protein [Vitreoscilla sp. C1]UOO93267.1 PACE efflux transporter [Vitreoscilla stercoraria]